MKILIVFNHPAPYKVRLFNELAKKYDIHVLFERKKASNRPDNFYSEEIKFSYEFLKGKNIGEENFISKGIIKHVQTHHYDLIIMNGYSTFAEMKAIKYFIKNNIPYTLYVNGGFARIEPKWKKDLKTKLISHAKFYFAPSEEAKKFLVYYGANPSNVYLYTYSTVYEDEILKQPLTHDQKIKLRKELDIPTRHIYISTSRFEERKNLTKLIYFFIDEMPKDTNLLLIGGGPLTYQYLQIIRKEKANNIRVYEHMSREEMFKYLRASDVYLFPTLEDIYGHVVNEAMANGLPVISSDKSLASLKLIKNGYNGYIYPSGDKETFKKDIDELRKKNLTNNALKTARENTIEKMVKDHYAIFEDVKEKL